MAAELRDRSSSSNSDESIINDVLSARNGAEEYLFKPWRHVEEGLSAEESEGERSSDTDTVETTDRRTDVNAWCRCGRCSIATLGREKECICCDEKTASRRLATQSNRDESVCIVNSDGFFPLCLSRVVLRNVRVALNNIRGDRWNVNPPNNRAYRHAAYRQVTWRIHGKLGPGRRTIPSCAVHAIRQAFPKDEDEEYQAFVSGAESSDADNN